MGIVKTHQEPERPNDKPAAHDAAEQVPPWEEIATGRYRPRRIRGSFPGRELG